jgi:hypothetical protein
MMQRHVATMKSRKDPTMIYWIFDNGPYWLIVRQVTALELQRMVYIPPPFMWVIRK